MVSQTTFDTSRIMVDFNQMKAFGQDPLILERGEGIRVTDVYGKTYIDGSREFLPSTWGTVSRCLPRLPPSR